MSEEVPHDIGSVNDTKQPGLKGRQHNEHPQRLIIVVKAEDSTMSTKPQTSQFTTQSMIYKSPTSPHISASHKKEICNHSSNHCHLSYSI